MLWLIDVIPGTWCGVCVIKNSLIRSLVTKGTITVQAGLRLAGKQANLKIHSAYPVRRTILVYDKS